MIKDLGSKMGWYAHTRSGPGSYTVYAGSGAAVYAPYDGTVMFSGDTAVVVSDSGESITFTNVRSVKKVRVKKDETFAAARGNVTMTGSFDWLNRKYSTKGKLSVVGARPASGKMPASASSMISTMAKRNATLIEFDNVGFPVTGTPSVVSPPLTLRVLNGKGRPHHGADFANSGAALSIADGVVSAAGFINGYGNTVQINHGSYYSFYAHLQSILVTPGQSVKRGQKIGVIGATGGNYRTHLHLEIRPNGVKGADSIYATRQYLDLMGLSYRAPRQGEKL